MGELEDFKDNLEESVEESAEDVSDAVDDLGETFSDIGEQPYNAIHDRADVIQDTAEVVSAIGDMVENTGEAMSEFEGLGEAIEDSIGSRTGPVGDYAAGNLGEALETGAEVALEAGDAAAGVAGGVIGGIGDVIEAVGNVEGELRDGNLEGVPEAGKNVVEATAEGLVDIGSEIVEGAMGITEQVGEGAIEMVAEALSLDDVADALSDPDTSTSEPSAKFVDDSSSDELPDDWQDFGPPYNPADEVSASDAGETPTSNLNTADVTGTAEGISSGTPYESSEFVEQGPPYDSVSPAQTSESAVAEGSVYSPQFESAENHDSPSGSGDSGQPYDVASGAAANACSYDPSLEESDPEGSAGSDAQEGSGGSGGTNESADSGESAEGETADSAGGAYSQSTDASTSPPVPNSSQAEGGEPPQPGLPP